MLELVVRCSAAQAMTKKVADRNQTVLYGFAFMQAYQAARRIPQEAAYNLARAAHELNLLHVAVPFYEQALQCVSQLLRVC
jgi:general transcription factor 3C polypeptide 3 (transcription factor C subunit 4)